MSVATPNIGALVEERVIRAIHINLEERYEGAIRFAQALGIDGGELLRCCADADDLEKALVRVYAEPFESRRDAIVDMVPDVRDARFHPVGASLLRGLGVEPWDLAYLSAWSEESISLELPDGNCPGLYWVRDENRTSISVHLGQHVSWEHDGQGASILNVDLPIPDTLKPSLAGRRLADVVQHPLLETLGLVIERASESSGGSMELRLADPAR